MIVLIVILIRFLLIFLLDLYMIVFNAWNIHYLCFCIIFTLRIVCIKVEARLLIGLHWIIPLGESLVKIEGDLMRLLIWSLVGLFITLVCPWLSILLDLEQWSLDMPRIIRRNLNKGQFQLELPFLLDLTIAAYEVLDMNLTNLTIFLWGESLQGWAIASSKGK